MTEKNNLMVNFITLHMQHHAKSSGYDRLCDYIDANVISSVNNWSFNKRAITRLLRFATRRSGQTWYHRKNLYSEIQAARQWFRSSGQIFHFLYGENSYRYLGNLKALGRRNSIICTYHTPPDKFLNVVHKHSHLKYLDAIVVVSTMQREFFSDLIGADRVFYVPHGVDVDYFEPKNSVSQPTENFRCLFVGSHLRDFKTLCHAAHMLKHHKSNIEFNVVTFQGFHHYFHGLDNVKLFADISDKKLLELYQESDIFVLPLLECTANNVLLEAMACGKPIVSTDLQGVRDYVNDNCALLTEKDNPASLAEAIISLADDDAARRKMALASRTLANQFSWEKVAAQVRKVYEQVAG